MKDLIYIDPGTGTILFQMVIAGVVTLLSLSKKIQLFLKEKFNNIFRKR